MDQLAPPPGRIIEGFIKVEDSKVSKREANLQPVSRGERAVPVKLEPETDASQILSREAYSREELLSLLSIIKKEG